jgi:hypothetical protein
MSRFSSKALAFLLMLVWPGLVMANCLDYGTTAAAQQTENLDLGCGFSGLRWHGDVAAHTGFCSLVGEATASGETAIREAELARCRPVPDAMEEEVAEPVDETEQDANECRRSEVAEGTGDSNQSARNAAHSMLGRGRAEMMNEGLTECLYHNLGCSGPGNERTCWMSVECCAG